MGICNKISLGRDDVTHIQGDEHQVCITGSKDGLLMIWSISDL